MSKSIKWTCLIVFLAVMLMLMSSIPVVMAKNVNSLHLEAIPGTYVGVVDDAWLSESWITTATTFDLNLTNWNAEDIYYMYLLVAVDRDPAGNVTVNVSGSTVGPYNGVIQGNGKALVENTTPSYAFPGHGIYNVASVDTHFAVVNITSFIPGGTLVRYENMSVFIEITPVASDVRVHFDAVGADASYNAVASNPGSHDVTYNVPEFATIAIPVTAVLGLLFFFNHRKKRGE